MKRGWDVWQSSDWVHRVPARRSGRRAESCYLHNHASPVLAQLPKIISRLLERHSPAISHSLPLPFCFILVAGHMAVAPPTQQRVPAWKRIGLKLTHAQDQAEGSSSLGRIVQPAADSPASPPTGQVISTDALRPQKRRKTSPETSNSLQPSAKRDVHRLQSPDLQTQAHDAEVAIKAQAPVPQKPVR